MDSNKYTDKDRWLELLRDSDSNDFSQVSNLNDKVEPSYCALGILMESAMVSSHKYKPTLKSRFRNLRERLGYWVGSKIAGFNLDNREWGDYDTHRDY